MQITEITNMNRLGGGIAGVLERSYASLNDSFNLLRPTESFEDCKQSIIEEIDGGTTAADLALDLWVHYLPRTDESFRTTPILLSIAYLIQAQRLFESGDREKAWNFVSEGCFYAGVASNETIHVPTLIEAANRQEIARNGGNARAEKLKPAKNKVVLLLKEKCPVGGWGKPSEVVAKIEGDIREFVISQSIALSPLALANTLKRWLRADEEIRTAYDMQRAKKLSKSK